MPGGDGKIVVKEVTLLCRQGNCPGSLNSLYIGCSLFNTENVLKALNKFLFALRDYHQHITNIVLIIGVIIALVQLNTSKNIESAKLMIDFNNQLRNNQNNYKNIIASIYAEAPLIKPKGKYTEIDIDSFLLEWELLNQLRENRLISEDMAYDAFSYDVVSTWHNKEIKQYVADASVLLS